ncbi:MAG: TetR/AcrR family transcriptional regulator, partial [Bacteroidota bacterium]
DGINKAMLHYYFRSKEKLFRVILTEAIELIAPMMAETLGSEAPIMTKLQRMVERYVALLLEHPHLPLFVMHEISQNQASFIREMRHRERMREIFPAFAQQLAEEIATGKIREIHPVHLIMNTMSMIVFPFIAAPMVQTMSDLPKEAIDQILAERSEQINDFLRRAMQP